MHGTVVRVDKDEVLVDIGYKSEGVIPVAELSIRRIGEPGRRGLGRRRDRRARDDEGGRRGAPASSRRSAPASSSPGRRSRARPRAGEPVNGRVIEVVKGGLILDLGVRGFLPASLVDIRRVQDLDEFLGKELRCKVIELNRSRNNVVLSRRAVLEDERKEMRQAILDRLNPGDVVEGTISNIVDFGAFVDLDGMDGLIHISELSWSHVNHPSEVLEIGQTVNVKVLDIDRERQRISLGLKQTQSDPWQQVLDHYGEGDVVEGRVTKVVTFGAFVEILPGVEGLVHISELARAPRREPARGRLAGRPGQRADPRDRRRAPPPLALAQARRGGRPCPCRAPTAASPSTRRPTSGSRRRPSRRAAARPRSRRPRRREARSRPTVEETEAVDASRPRRPTSSRAETPRTRRRRDRAEVEDEAPSRGRGGGRARAAEAERRARGRRRATPRAEPEADEPAPSRAEARLAPTPAPPDRGRDHGRDRRRQVDGARGVPRARRGDRLERRDRPPPPRDRRRGARRARRAPGRGDPR